MWQDPAKLVRISCQTSEDPGRRQQSLAGSLSLIGIQAWPLWRASDVSAEPSSPPVAQHLDFQSFIQLSVLGRVLNRGDQREHQTDPWQDTPSLLEETSFACPAEVRFRFRFK